MAHDDDFEEYVEDGPERPGGRRLLVIILSVGCVALAISNIVLATRLAQLRRPATVERAAVEPAAPAASIPSPPTSPTPPSPPPAATSAPAPEATAPAPATTPARVQPDLPPRPTPRAAVRAERAAARAERAETKTEQAAPAPWSRERSTASWMVQEYGRPDAEARARAAVDFYDTRSPEAAYWRRVLGEIVTARR